MYDIAADADFDLVGRVLRPGHRPHIASRHKLACGSPFVSNGSGALKVYTVDAAVAVMASRICETLSGQDRLAASLKFRLLQHVHAEGTWNHRKIVGFDERWAPHQVSTGPPRPEPASRLAPLVAGHGSDADSSMGATGDGDDDDFASMPSRASMPPPRTPGRETALAIMDVPPEEHDAYCDVDEITNPHGDGAIEVEDDASDTSHEGGGGEFVDDGFHFDIAASSSPFADAHAHAGVLEIDSVIFLAGVRIGHIEWLHSKNISVKVVCECEAHRVPDGAPDARACYVLLNVNRQIMDKYNRALEWLVEQVRCTRDEHLSRAIGVRAEFGLLR